MQPSCAWEGDKDQWDSGLTDKEENMIGYAIQKGNRVYVYDDKNQEITNKSGELLGFSSTSYVVKNGRQVLVYDEHGRILKNYND